MQHETTGRRKSSALPTLAVITAVTVLLFAGMAAPIALFLREFMSWEATTTLIAGVVTLLSLVPLVIGYMKNSEAEQELAQREIYQRLELASIDLFRFECVHPQVAALLWDLQDGENATDHVAKLSFTDGYALRAYLFQLLNLFEMATRFRAIGIMDREAFGSWVIWMADVAGNPRFQVVWGEVRTNYVGLLQRTFNDGIAAIARAAADPEPSAQERAFFHAVGDVFDCDTIRRWHVEKGLVTAEAA